MKRIDWYLGAFAAYQKGYGLVESTVKRSSYYLKRLSGFLGKKDIREVVHADMVDYMEYLRTLKNNRGKVIKPESIRVELSVLKGFFEWLYKTDQILINPMEDIEVRQPAGGSERNIFTEEDIAVFLDSIGIATATGQRDRALFELMYSSGFRVEEITGLKLEEVNLEERICFVVRKGRKDGYVPFSETALKFLLLYIGEGRKWYLKKVRNTEMKDFLFLNASGKMSWKSLRTKFRKYLAGCGLDGKGYVMHSVRHATATHLIAHGASIRYVQELLGHESLKTTQIYTRPTRENIKRVYRTYHPRENEFYKEVDAEYLREVEKLKRRIIWQKEETRKQRVRLRRRGLIK